VKATFEVQDMAALQDGGFLIADQLHDRVRKVDAHGTITTVAGGGRLRGEGVPATRARLDTPWSVAVTPDGGFVVIEDFGRVRRVAPDWLIRTIAGTCEYPYTTAPAEGEPAISAAINVEDAAIAGDGSVLLADLGDARVLRVTPGGALTLAARLPTDDGPLSVAAEPDGGFLVVTRDPRQVWRFAPDGSHQVLAGARPFAVTAPNGLLSRVGGEPALHAFLGDVQDAQALPDGGVLVSAGAWGYDGLGGFIDYIAPAAPRVLGAALLRTRDRVIGAQTFASVSLTLPATVTLTVAGHSTTAQLPAGLSRVALPPVPADRPHRVWLVATAADGQRTYDAARVYPPRWLPRETAGELTQTLARRLVHPGHFGPFVGHCRRFAATRVDCSVHGDKRSDCASVAVRFTGGRVRWGAYGCRLSTHPRYSRRVRPLSRRDARCDAGKPGCLAGRVDEAALLPSR
jgi:hypothetical protein